MLNKLSIMGCSCLLFLESYTPDNNNDFNFGSNNNANFIAFYATILTLPDNPITTEKVELARASFWNSILSRLPDKITVFLCTLTDENIDHTIPTTIPSSLNVGENINT